MFTRNDIDGDRCAKWCLESCQGDLTIALRKVRITEVETSTGNLRWEIERRTLGEQSNVYVAAVLTRRRRMKTYITRSRDPDQTEKGLDWKMNKTFSSIS